MKKALGGLFAGSLLVVVLAQASCNGGGTSATPNCDEYCACSAITKAVCDAKKQAGQPITEPECKQALSDLKSQNLCTGSSDAATGG